MYICTNTKDTSSTIYMFNIKKKKEITCLKADTI